MPQDIAFHLADLLEFSKTALLLSKIPDYIKHNTHKISRKTDAMRSNLQATGLRTAQSGNYYDFYKKIGTDDLLIGLYTGLRQEEIVHLHKTGICSNLGG